MHMDLKKKKGYKQQHLESNYCGENIFPPSRERQLSYLTVVVLVSSENSQVCQSGWNDISKVVSLGDASSDLFLMGKECVHISNSQSNHGSLWWRSSEQAACSKMVLLFSVRQRGCGKLQYGSKWLSKFWKSGATNCWEMAQCAGKWFLSQWVKQIGPAFR